MFNLALKLAAAGRNHAPPNPCIGCVIVSDDGLLLGLGHSQHAGGNHAEIMALRDAHSRMNKVEGATAYVTLEPCSHHGRTGPCCDALIDAKIARVIATQADPNPLVAGQGFARLRAAGIAVEVLTPDHPVAVQARELNIGFFSRMVRKRPWVRMKVAQSLDGKTALNNGASQWITSPEARADGHAWRARACAILTGSGTVLSDRPRLDVRLVETSRQPHVVIVDSSLQTPPESALFIQGRKVFIYCAQADPDRRRALEAAGAVVIELPERSADNPSATSVDLGAMMLDLGKREINELHVEAGQRLNGSLVRERLVDEVVAYIAPTILGQGRDMAAFGPLSDLSQALQLHFTEVTMVGADIRAVARVVGSNVF